MRAGIIGDPAIGFNEHDQFWVGECDWEYRTTFRVDPRLTEHERIELVCDGLDTIATLHMNGATIGTAANMFHPHRFDITSIIKLTRRTKPHELRIVFRSPLAHIRSEEAKLGARPVNGDWDPYIFIRKAACNFGWDWGPKVPTVGIWKPIRLQAWTDARLASVRVNVERADASLAVVRVDADLAVARTASAGGVPLHLHVDLTSVNDRRAAASETRVVQPGSVSANVSLTVARPSLWWPREYGGQPLYNLRVRLARGRETLSTHTSRIGLRTVVLNTDTDRHGSKFQIEINGKPIFCKGANWIPDDLFPTRCTPAKLRRRVRQAAEANMNMLRVWGGGYYEDAAFYSACDKMGILVWQDFMFSCAMYPEEPPFPTLIKSEANHQIARLSHHPSVVLWCGGNECVWGWQKWGWKERLLPKQTWGSGYYFGLLPALIKQLCPTTPYWPNSPWSASLDSPDGLSRDVLDPSHGDRHTWDAQFEEYERTVPRFLSEFGRQAPANIRTLREAVGAAGLAVDSPQLQHRQRATGGNAAMYDAAFAKFGIAPKSFSEWHRSAQELQTEALTIACEWAIRNQPRCMGVLIWQLNDCWPALSWSLIDSAGRPKPAYYAVLEIFARSRTQREQMYQRNARSRTAIPRT